MIQITSLNGEKMFLNCDLIYKIEEFSDTIITLTDGKTLRVCESGEEIVEKIVSYKRRIFKGTLGE
ncbi:MAG: flagellar FlbD family protein [Gudongella sp.]|nr:flagellar FlbD family protein [Gudongella sp.]